MFYRFPIKFFVATDERPVRIFTPVFRVNYHFFFMFDVQTAVVRAGPVLIRRWTACHIEPDAL